MVKSESKPKKSGSKDLSPKGGKSGSVKGGARGEQLTKISEEKGK